MRKKYWIGYVLIFLILIISFIPYASALTKDYDAKTKTISIYSGVNKVGELRLVHNTDYCLTDCEALIEITPFYDLNTITLGKFEKNFYDIIGKARIISSSWDWYYLIDSQVPVYREYESICQKSWTDYNSTAKIRYYDALCMKDEFMGYRTEKLPEKKDIGGTLFAGTSYYIKLEGRKNPFDSIEWVVTFADLELKEWAPWQGGLFWECYNFTITANTTKGISNGRLNLNVSANGAYPITNWSNISWIGNSTNSFRYTVYNATSGSANATVIGNWTDGDVISWCFGNTTSTNYDYNVLYTVNRSAGVPWWDAERTAEGSDLWSQGWENELGTTGTDEWNTSSRAKFGGSQGYNRSGGTTSARTTKNFTKSIFSNVKYQYPIYQCFRINLSGNGDFYFELIPNHDATLIGYLQFDAIATRELQYYGDPGPGWYASGLLYNAEKWHLICQNIYNSTTMELFLDGHSSGLKSQAQGTTGYSYFLLAPGDINNPRGVDEIEVGSGSVYGDEINLSSYVSANWSKEINGPPTIITSFIEPEFPYENENLTCTFNITDDTLTSFLSVNISFIENITGDTNYSLNQSVISGSNYSVILDAGNLSVGQEWLCYINAFDSEYHAVINTSIVTIQALPSGFIDAYINWTNLPYYTKSNTTFNFIIIGNTSSYNATVTVYNGSAQYAAYDVDDWLNDTTFTNTTSFNQHSREIWNISLSVPGAKLNSTKTLILNPLNITLQSPLNRTNTTDNTPDFIFNYTHLSNSSIASCSLYVNDTLKGSNSSTVSGKNTTITSTALNDGLNQNWSINCTDGFDNITSEIRIIGIDTVLPVITLYEPVNEYFTPDLPYLDLPINFSYVEANPEKCWFGYNSTQNTTLSSCQNTTANIYQTGGMNFYLYMNDTFGNENYASNSIGINLYNVSHVANADLATEGQIVTFTLSINSTNITTVNGTLNFNGTLYNWDIRQNSSHQANISRNITIPQIATNTNLSYNWTYSINSFTNSTDSKNISASPAALSLCDGVTYTIPFINITFKDESSLSSMNATIDTSSWSYYLASNPSYVKSMSFINLTANPSYAFCYTPAYESIYSTFTIQFASSGYPQRRRTFTTQYLTNITTNLTLYLLATADGLYSRYAAVDAMTGNSIQGVSVTVRRTISGSNITIGEGITDSSGLVTFWLNPDYDHYFTATKAGYAPVSFTVRPTSTDIYYILMGSTGTVTPSINVSYGLQYSILPEELILQNNTNYNFSFCISSGYTEYDSMSMNLTNGSFQFYHSTKAGQGCLSHLLNTSDNASIVGYFRAIQGTEIFEVTRVWSIEYTYIGNYSLMAWLGSFDDYEFREMGVGIRVLIMVVTILIIGISLSFIDPIDSSIASILAIIFGVFIFSYISWLTIPITANAWTNKWAVFIIIFILGTSLITWRAQTQ